MAAGEEFRGLIAAVVNNRLVQRAESRTGICGDVLEAERFDDVHHEIRAGPVRGVHVRPWRRWAGLGGDQSC